MKIRGFHQYWPQAVLLLFAGVAPAAAQLPVISSTATQFFFNYAQGATSLPAAQSANVTSSTGAVIINSTNVTYLAGGPTGWLSVSSSSSVTPTTLTFSILSTGVISLTPGLYTAQVTIDAGTVDPSSQTVITVNLNVTPGTGGGGAGVPTLTASPSILNFAFIPGSAAPATQAITVSATDTSGISAVASTNDGGTWLTVTPASLATTPGVVNVGVNAAALSPGLYFGTITLSGVQLIVIPVNLTVGTTPFTITPTSLTFNVPQNYGVSAPQYISITTATPVPFSSFATSDSNWLQIEAPGGTTPALLAVRVNPGSLAQGTYTGKVTFQQTPSYSVDVPVTLNIGGAAVLSIAPSSVTTSFQIGDPAPITQSIRVTSTSTTAQSFTSSVTLVTGTGWLTATAAGNATPTIVNLSIDPSALPVGTYIGTVRLTPSAPSTSPQDITVVVTVTAAPTPVITAVQSAASGAPGTIAPGELVTIVGRGLGPKQLVVFPSNATTVPTTVGNTTVTIGGVAAPIIYASSTATTVQVPYSVPPNSQPNVKLTYTTAASANFQVTVQPIYPGLFSLDATGRGQAAALNQDFTVNSPGNPAKRGSIMVLYGTGEGVTTPALTTGQIVPLTPPFPQPAVQPLVFFNGQQGKVLYAGEAPGSVSGLFQINVQVPDNIPIGAISVQAAFGGQGTQSGLTVSIQ